MTSYQNYGGYPISQVLPQVAPQTSLQTFPQNPSQTLSHFTLQYPPQMHLQQPPQFSPQIPLQLPPQAALQNFAQAAPQPFTQITPQAAPQIEIQNMHQPHSAEKSKDIETRDAEIKQRELAMSLVKIEQLRAENKAKIGDLERAAEQLCRTLASHLAFSQDKDKQIQVLTARISQLEHENDSERGQNVVKNQQLGDLEAKLHQAEELNKQLTAQRRGCLSDHLPFCTFMAMVRTSPEDWAETFSGPGKAMDELASHHHTIFNYQAECEIKKMAERDGILAQLRQESREIQAKVEQLREKNDELETQDRPKREMRMQHWREMAQKDNELKVVQKEWNESKTDNERLLKEQVRIFREEYEKMIFDLVPDSVYWRLGMRYIDEYRTDLGLSPKTLGIVFNFWDEMEIIRAELELIYGGTFFIVNEFELKYISLAEKRTEEECGQESDVPNTQLSLARAAERAEVAKALFEKTNRQIHGKAGQLVDNLKSLTSGLTQGLNLSTSAVGFVERACSFITGAIESAREDRDTPAGSTIVSQPAVVLFNSISERYIALQKLVKSMKLTGSDQNSDKQLVLQIGNMCDKARKATVKDIESLTALGLAKNCQE